ncbi:RNA pyrophosphohydrolase [Pseudomonas savastanoi pv. glycinea str. race 4]|uniref:RNA pyrophosphohydrolase n=1 Tax=Pseudomonas savastanoi pv. glycinea str. race 4 TaxID=875330 RepID=F3BZJ9_PSESG|nr:RNA pyrophosphohydrolase [Pseudomonas savastanoi pv. glycinea str. race 4]
MKKSVWNDMMCKYLPALGAGCAIVCRNVWSVPTASRCVSARSKNGFFLRLISNEQRVRMDLTGKPEFDGWRWVSYWYPLGQVVTFKREVYRRALKELAPRLLSRD